MSKSSKEKIKLVSGDTIREWRRDLGLTQKMFADEVGITVIAVGNIENGLKINELNAIKLSQFFDKELGYFQEGGE